MYNIFLYNLGEENGGPLEKSFSIVGPASLQKESGYRPVEHHVLILLCFIFSKKSPNTIINTLENGFLQPFI